MNGGSPIGAAAAKQVPLAVSGIEADDNGTLTLSDGAPAHNIVVNITNGALSAATADVSGLIDGTITATLHLNNDAAGNSFTDVVATATLDRDIGEQAALKLKIGSAIIGAAKAPATPFTVTGLDPEDTGTATFTDINGKTVTVSVSGAQTSYTADLTSLAEGTIASSLSVNPDT